MTKVYKDEAFELMKLTLLRDGDNFGAQRTRSPLHG